MDSHLFAATLFLRNDAGNIDDEWRQIQRSKGTGAALENVRTLAQSTQIASVTPSHVDDGRERRMFGPFSGSFGESHKIPRAPVAPTRVDNDRG